jgi:hypothetical protein
MDYETRIAEGLTTKRSDENAKEYVPGFEQDMNQIFGYNDDDS